MIGYKYVVKNGNEYDSLMKYKIDRGESFNCESYKIGHVYNKPKALYSPHYYTSDKLHKPGYHFFKSSNPDRYYINSKNDIKKWWESYLSKVNNKDIKLNLLKCDILDIIDHNEIRIVANKFKVLLDNH